MQPGRANNQRLVNELETHAETFDRSESINVERRDDDGLGIRVSAKTMASDCMVIGDYAHFEY